MQNTKKHILITGGSGFIGRNLAEKLFSSYAIFAPSHEELDLLNEPAVKEYLSSNQFYAVLHCASVGVSQKDNVSGIGDTNVQMFLNLAHCGELYEKMFFLGSGAEYDKR